MTIKYPSLELRLEKLIDLLVVNPNAFTFVYTVNQVDMQRMYLRLCNDETKLYAYIFNFQQLVRYGQLKVSVNGTANFRIVYDATRLSQVHNSVVPGYNVYDYIHDVLARNAWVGYIPISKIHHVRMLEKYRKCAAYMKYSWERYYPDAFLTSYPDTDTHYQSVLFT